MTLQGIIRRVLFTVLPTDRRLRDVDVRLRMRMQGRAPDTLSGWAAAADMDTETARRSLNRLMEFGWADRIAKDGPGRQLIGPCMPIAVEAVVAERLQLVRLSVPRVGEWLMMCWLDLLAASDDIIDNSRPGWLRSPGSSARFELDREYPSARVAFEFQGSQHLVIGGPYAHTQEEYAKQVDRDNIKAGICVRNRYRLIEITKEDLTLDRMISKVQGVLPIAYYLKGGPIEAALSDMSRAYISYTPPN